MKITNFKQKFQFGGQIHFFSMALLFVSCAHHRDVRPGADGIHTVIIHTDESEEGSRNAISQANHFCEERQQSAAFVNEDTKYTGSMDKENYDSLKTASKVAKTVGGAAWVFGGRQEKNVGGLVGLGGVVADDVAGKGYTVQMKFKCQ